jgi:hypothetical protein
MINRKGVSIMIGYVLLIVIVIGLSVLVFAFLQLYLPSEKPKCPGDISLIIEPVCSPGNINIFYTNKGLFSVDGALVRVGEVGRLAKDLINEDNVFTFLEGSIEPGKTWTQDYDYDYSEPELKELEIEPVMFIDNEAVLCDGAIVSRIIECP